MERFDDLLWSDGVSMDLGVLYIAFSDSNAGGAWASIEGMNLVS